MRTATRPCSYCGKELPPPETRNGPYMVVCNSCVWTRIYSQNARLN